MLREIVNIFLFIVVFMLALIGPIYWAVHELVNKLFGVLDFCGEFLGFA